MLCTPVPSFPKNDGTTRPVLDGALVLVSHPDVPLSHPAFPCLLRHSPCPGR